MSEQATMPDDSTPHDVDVQACVEAVLVRGFDPDHLPSRTAAGRAVVERAREIILELAIQTSG